MNISSFPGHLYEMLFRHSLSNSVGAYSFCNIFCVYFVSVWLNSVHFVIIYPFLIITLEVGKKNRRKKIY